MSTAEHPLKSRRFSDATDDPAAQNLVHDHVDRVAANAKRELAQHQLRAEALEHSKVIGAVLEYSNNQVMRTTALQVAAQLLARLGNGAS